MKKFLTALFVLALGASVAMATVPDPTRCSVSPADALHGLVLCPDSPAPIPASVYTVTVRNSDNNPINNSPVEFDLQLGATLRLCTTAVMTGFTNNAGQVVITLRGGGCVTGATAGVVKASGITIKTYTAVKSPDFDGAAPSGAVNLADLVSFKAGNDCHNYDNQNGVDLGDLVIFAGAYSPAHSCTLQ